MNALALLLAAALSSGNAEFERASVDAAAGIALGQLKAEIADRGLATNALERAMLADPAAYRARTDAERICRALYRDELEKSYRERSRAICRELGCDDRSEAPDAKFLDEAAGKHFARAFDAERKAACDAQAAHIAIKVKPDEADLESKSEAEARTWLTTRIAEAKGSTVFEENLKYISEKIVDPILADARRELKRQKEYLLFRSRCDAWSPDALARELEANLRKDVAERKAKCDDPERAWGVFPATLKSTLPVAVEKRILSLVSKEVDGVAFVPDAESVRKTIFANPEAHRKSSDSEKIFREQYAKEVAERALARANERAPAAEREAFAAFVREHVASADLDRAVETRLRRDVLPKWKVLRREIADTEAARLWPTLTDKTWFPEAELADKTAARSDYANAVRDWRKAPELKSLAGTGGTPLEESDATADTSVAAAFDLARSAIAAQRTLVGKVHPAILTAAKDLSKGLFTAKPDLAKVIEMMTSAVEKEWRETRVETLWGDRTKPANAEVQHKELFPSVRREIELVARQILEEVEKVEKVEAEKKPETEKKPEEPPPEDSPSEETSEEAPEEELCTISFELSGGEVTVQAKRGSSVVAERKAKATARGFEDAVRQVGAIVGREIFMLK